MNGITATGNATISDTGGSDTIFIDANTLADAKHVNNDLVLTLTTGATVTVLDQFGSHPVETLVEGSTALTLATSMTGGIGSGIISGTDGNDVMDGRGGDDWLYGNGGNDRLIGGTGNDHLFGGAGNDVLEGDEGDDVLDGGPGNNRLIGGAGNDVFVFAPKSETLDFGRKDSDSGGANHDTIVDFVRGQDRIDLTAFHTDFAALTAGDGRGRHDDGHDDDRGNSVRLVTEGHDSVLIFAGGDVRIEGVAHLDASDFIFGATPGKYVVGEGLPSGMSGSSDTLGGSSAVSSSSDPQVSQMVQAMASFPSGAASPVTSPISEAESQLTPPPLVAGQYGHG